MRFTRISLYTILAAALAACGGSSSNPDTASRSDLNGPKNLRSIAVKKNAHAEVTLIWNSFNAEEELKGYHVFGMELTDTTTLTEIAARVKYPATLTEDQLAHSSFPRCEDNSTFFEVFGLPATDGKCEDAAKDEVELSNSRDQGYTLAADEEEEDEGPLKSKLSCEGHDSTNVSLPTSGIQLGTQKCVVRHLKDAQGNDIAIEAGKTYLFFVAAISTDKFNKMSWISNVVKDTPSTLIFSDTVTLETGAAASTSTYVKLSFEADNTLKKEEPSACTDAICRLSTLNTDNSLGFYFGRDNSSKDNRERSFISVPATANKTTLTANDEIGIQYKRPAISREFAQNSNVSDIGTDGFHPGDSAGSVYVYDGTHFQISGDQIFDFQVRRNGATYYGKIIITDWAIDGVSDIAAQSSVDVKKPVSFRVQAVIQTKPDTTDYWTSH